MSDSVRPQRQQPTRLPHPWDSPGKNTGVGCHFLLQCMKVKSEREVTQSCPTLSDPMDCSLPSSSIHGIFQARVLEWGAIAFSKEDTWKSSNMPHYKVSPTRSGTILFWYLFLSICSLKMPGTQNVHNKYLWDVLFCILKYFIKNTYV